MIQRLRTAVVTGSLLLVFAVAHVQASSFAELYNSAIDAFEDRNFTAAAAGFRSAAAAGNEDEQALAWFWAGRSDLAATRTQPAAQAFHEFLRRAETTHQLVPEARYQLGRIAFLEAEFQQALQVFDAFLDDYSDHSLAGNALYWSGESLLALGRPEEAAMLFNAVVASHSDSPRFEAARFRLDVIALNRREQELIELLRLSAEEQVRLANSLQAEREAHRATREGMLRLETEELRDAERALERAQQELDRERREVQIRSEELDRRLEAVQLQEELLTLIGAYAEWLEGQE